MIGVDEVGRGAWAGPLLVVAARVRPQRSLPEGLTDSKLLSKKQREFLYESLQLVCDFGEGWVSVEEIDELGLSVALKTGAARAVASLASIEDDEICIDGSVNFLKDLYPKAYCRVKADMYEPIVSAASIYAKVGRDKHMARLHFEDPRYGFNAHVGYGTAEHITALKKHGVTAQHRKSFKPIMELL
jgi:ribonuclease HII